MFKNLKLRDRILMGYSVPIFLSILVAVIVYISASTVIKQFAVVETKYQCMIEINHVEIAVSQMARGVRGYILAEKEGYLKTFEEGEKDFKNAIERLRQIVTDQRQHDLISKVEDFENRYISFMRGMITLVGEGKQAQAVQQFKTDEGQRLFGEIKIQLGEMEKREDVILEEAKKGGSSSLNFLIRVVWVGALISTIFAIAISFWIATTISRTIDETVSSLSATSTEIASTVEQHERTASGQAASVSETTTTMDELSASTRRSAEQADSVAAIAKQTMVTTEEGVKMANQASQGMSTMKQKVGAIGEQILKLSEQTGQIGSIANMVTDIAGQINMLALNAAVEAVRAGESGKGFSVIAQEVRKLADQGKKSAEKVNTIVADVQKATNSAVMVTEAGTKTVEDVSQIAQRAGESFASLSAVANNVYENAQQVSLNMKQQVAAIRQVTEAMGNINAGAKETAAGISQTKIGIQRLNDAAQELKKMV